MQPRKITVVPTLILGLGGTGSLGIQFAKNYISEQLKPYTFNQQVPEKIPFVKFFSIDTTGQEKDYSNLSGDEFEYIGALTSREIKNMKRNHKDELRWFPDSLSSAQINAGARGVRQLGRLCFYKYKPVIETRLIEKINKLKNLDKMKTAIEKYFINVSPETEASRIDIHLITSMCGGTGSSCLLDVAFLLRHLLKNLNPRISAHLVGPEGFTADNSIGVKAKEYIKYNFAVTLAEIERFINVEENFSDEFKGSNQGKDPWTVQYPDSDEIIIVPDKPFDFTYLLGERSGGDKRNVKQICETIGLSVAVNTVRPEAVELCGKLENIPAHITNQKDKLKRLTAYSSYNVALLNADLSDEGKENLKYNIKKSIFDRLIEKHTIEKEEEAAARLCKVLVNKSLSESELEKYLEKIFKRYGWNKEDFFTGNEITVNNLMSKQPTASKTGWKNKLPFTKKQPKPNQSSNFTSRIKDVVSKAVEAEYSRCRSNISELETEIKKLAGQIETSIIDEIANMLIHKYSLSDIKTSLNKCAEEITNLLNFSERKYNDASNNSKLTGPIQDIIKYSDAGRTNEVATTSFRSKIYCDILSSFNDQLKIIQQDFRKWESFCGNALVQISERKEKLFFSSSASSSRINNSVLKVSDIEANVKKNISNNLKVFITQASQKNIPEFLSRKENGKAIDDLIEKVFEKVCEECVLEVRNVFSQSYPNPPFESIKANNIQQLIEMSSPLWNVESTGQTIEKLSIVNIAEDTQLGGIISQKLSPIFYDSQNNVQNGTNNGFNSLIIFQSAHGSSASKFVVLEDCMKSVNYKLRQDDKRHIRDLSLDPAWEIEDPLTGKAILDYYARFSLANLFGIIVADGNRFYLVNGTLRRKLGSNTATETTKRFEAFSYFVAERINVETKIEEHYTARIDNAVEFKQEIEAYIHTLEIKQNELEKTHLFYKEDAEQFEMEVEALQKIIIPEIEVAISNQKNKANLR